MAAAAASALLDELMGRDRNLNPAEKKRELRWDDPQVCKHFMSKFCPNELFINTRADLGPCDKIHDEFMKQEYEKSASYQRMGYEEDFIKFCQGMLADVERRIRRGKQRLALGNQEGSVPNAGQVQNNDDQIKILTERVNGMLEQVEALGCEGKVEEAQGIMKLCDQLKEERENLRRANENSHWLQTAEIAAAQEKQMEVCEVCGAFLIVGDAQQRVDDHLMGKQHMGYARIKIALEEMLEKKQKDKEEREKQREKDREERMQKRKEEETEKSKKRDEERRKEKKRSRSRSRGHKRSRSRDRKKSRSRSRDRKRSRSRNRSSRKHSYGKERRRSRSRSRGRSSRKNRRSRSRSRSRDRHRSSGDKRRDRDRDRDSRRSSEKEKEKGKKSPTPKDDANSTSEDKHFSNAKESADGDSHSDVQNNGSGGERNGVSVGGSEAKINGAVCEGD